MKRIVYYCMLGDSRSDQWIESVTSLRRFNRDVTVWMFLFNEIPEDLLETMERLDVTIYWMGDYATLLKRFHPCGKFLSENPCFAKFLVLQNLPRGYDQVLYVDCDTYFQGDVARLFDQCKDADVYAREEIFSRRHASGYDPTYVDEDKLEGFCRDLQINYIPPFNAGVVLLNHGVWDMISGSSLLDIIYRMRSGIYPYPSRSTWIVDMLALGIHLGAFPGLRFANFTERQVPTSNEYERESGILCHYFTKNQQQFFSWLAESQSIRQA